MSKNRPPIPRNRDPCDPPPEQSTNSFWHSEPSALLTGHRSTRDLPTTADVVIIGSGMTGTSVAHHLLTRSDGEAKPLNGEGGRPGGGPSVVMLEAREACWGATGRNGGHCQPLLYEHPHDPSIGHFELLNYHTLQTLINAKSIPCEWAAQPGVRAIYDSSHLTDVELALLAVQASAPDQGKLMRLVTSKTELEELRVPTAVGAVVTSVAARMWPYKLVARLLEDLLTSTELKGTFNLQTLTGVECLAPYDVDRWTVKTERGCVVADHVVLATNGYTSHLLPSFANLIVPCRGQMSALLPLPSVAGENRLKTSFGFEGELGDYLIQRPNERGGHLMFGGGRHTGLYYGIDDSVIDEGTAGYLRGRLVEKLALPEGKKGAEGDGSEVVEEEQKCDVCIRRKLRCRRASALQPCSHCLRQNKVCTLTPSSNPAGTTSSAKNQKQTTEFKATHEWTGIMGFSRDSLPWVGPLPDAHNLYISAGYTGHGMVNTWLCGAAVAKMVEKGFSGPRREAAPGAGADILDVQFHRAGAMYEAVREVGLPESYLVSKARMLKAMDEVDVEGRDWGVVEGVLRREREEGGRLASGYA